MRNEKRNEKRVRSAVPEQSFLRTLHSGFNYFQQIDLHRPKQTKTRTRFYSSQQNVDEGHRSLVDGLRENKRKFEKIKTEMSMLRDEEYGDYIYKSNKYQELLNINDHNKKRLPTLNAKVGEVVKKSTNQHLLKNIAYQATSTKYKIEGWKPESREGHSTTVFKNSAIMIGGHCSYPFSMAYVYSFENHLWGTQFPIHSARSYHTAILYKNRFIIIYGGMGSYDMSRKCRVCFSTINLVDLHSYTSRIIKINGEDAVQGRRSHAAVLMGKYMLVLGGMNTKREMLKDFVYVDLKELKWYEKEFKVEGKQLNENMTSGIAKHKIVTTFRSNHQNFPLYSSEYTDSEGLLIFGGQFGNGEENTVLQMSFNKYNPILKKVDFMGVPPSSLDPLIEKVSDNLVAIVAGDQYYRELRLYKIKERQFVGLSRHTNQEFYGGIGSTLMKFENEMYIFFGLGEEGYIGEINSFRIEEKVIESEVSKKKKERALPLGWKQNAEVSQDDSYRK